MKLLLVLALIGFSSALPVKEKQGISTLDDAGLVESIILEALDLIRDLIVNGSEDIPVLDPFVLEFLEIGEPGTHLAIYDTTVEHLSTFLVPRLSVTSGGLVVMRIFVTFDGHIPHLDISVRDYNLDIAVGGITVFGQGAASLSFIEPRLEGQITLRVRAVGGLEIEESDVRFHLRAFKSNIRGLLGDEAISDFFNAVFEYLIPDLVEFFKVSFCVA